MAILLKMKMDDTAERAEDEARLKKCQDRGALDAAILLKMKMELAVERAESEARLKKHRARITLLMEMQERLHHRIQLRQQLQIQ